MIRILLFLITASMTLASPYCALRITAQMKDPEWLPSDRKELGRTGFTYTAEVTDTAGRVVGRKDTNATGLQRSTGRDTGFDPTISFCDLDLGTYSVRITAFGAYAIEFPDIVVVPEEEQHLSVVLNHLPRFLSGDVALYLRGCGVQVRIVGEDRKPIPEAVLIGPDATYKVSEDGFAKGGLRAGPPASFTAQAPGFKSGVIEFTCDKPGPPRFATIVLKRQQ